MPHVLRVIGPRPRTPIAARVKATADFTYTTKQCFECNEDTHGGQFMSPGSEKDCSSCHTISKWSAGSFDHNRTDYPLDGAHSMVRCAQCHTQQKEIDGRVIRLYRGTTQTTFPLTGAHTIVTCVQCHGLRTPQDL